MVKLEGILTENRQLIVKIPDIVPAGRVLITIVSLEPLPPLDPNIPITREEVRRRLALKGMLANYDTLSLNSDDERPDIEPFILPLGSKSTEELIDEDRAER